jgi:hypothetical protein
MQEDHYLNFPTEPTISLISENPILVQSSLNDYRGKYTKHKDSSWLQ